MRSTLAITFLISTLVLGHEPDARASQSSSQIASAIQLISTDVVLATVTDTTPVFVDGEAHLVSEIVIDEALKGGLAGRLLVQVPGGMTPEGYQVIVSHQPRFSIGDRVELALLLSEQQQLTEAVDGSTDLSLYSIVGGLDGVVWHRGEGISQAEAAGDYAFTGSSWSSFTPPVEYVVNAALSGLDAAVAEQAVQRAFQMWEDDPGSAIDFSYGGSTTLGGDLGDNTNVVYWTATPNPAETFLAQASWITDGENMVSFDIKFNTDYPWSDGAVGGHFDVETVAAHEAGHALGLAHVAASSEIMYPTIMSGSVKGLGAGDRAGVRVLYPGCTLATPAVSTSQQLDAAIDCYNAQIPAGDHVITFAGDITHPDGAPIIDSSSDTGGLLIDGAGYRLIGPGALSGGGLVDLLTVDNPGPTTGIANLTITQADGDGVHASGGSVSVSNSTIANNGDSGVSVAGGSGGSGGSVSVSNSTIANNGNSGVSVSGGPGGSMAVSNSTIANNGFGASVSGGSLSVASSIVADNTTADCSGSVTDRGNSFGSDGSCPGFATLTGSLGGLADNGCETPASHGCVETVALFAGSNAIGGGDCTGVVLGLDNAGGEIIADLVADQRGRPRDAANCDAGAYEFAGALFVGLNPFRLLDTRDPEVAEFASPWGAGMTRSVTVVGVGGVDGVPAVGVEAVVLHLTTVTPTAPFSWLTVSPTGDEAASTAVHTFGTAAFTTELVNDEVIAKVGAGGKVDIRNQAGSVELVIDVVGYYSDTGVGFVPLSPQRILDTRNETQGAYSTPWEQDQTRPVSVTGVGGVPMSDVEAVAVHVTTVNPTALYSWLTVSPSGEAAAMTAVHNFGTSPTTTEIVNDLIIAKVGTDGKIDIRNEAGTVDLVVDVVGYFPTIGGFAFEPLNPTRILDTRNSTQGDYSTPWGPGQTRAVASPFGTCVDAIAVHVTTVDPTAAFSWLTVSPSGEAAAVTAVHNFGTAGYTSEIANDLIIAKVGTSGSIDIRNQSGTVDLVIDLVGVYGSDGCP